MANTDLVAKLKIQNENAKKEIKDLKAALSTVQSQCRKMNRELSKTKGGNGLSSLTDKFRNILGLGRENTSMLGALSGGFTKLAGVVGLAVGAGETFKRTMEVNDALMDEWNRTTASAKDSLDTFLIALSNGDISIFTNNIKAVTQAAKDAYDAIDTLGSYKNFMAVHDSNEEVRYRQLINLAQDRNLAEKDRLKYLNMASKVMHDQTEEMLEQLKMTREAAKAKFTEIMTKRGLSAKEQEMILNWIKNGQWRTITQLSGNYTKNIAKFNKKHSDLSVSESNAFTPAWVDTQGHKDLREEQKKYENTVNGRKEKVANIFATQILDTGEYKEYIDLNNEYNNLLLEIEAKKKELEATKARINKALKSSNTSANNRVKDEIKAAETQIELEKLQSQQARRQAKDTEFANRQADIDLNPDEYDAIQKQTELDKDKAIEQIKRDYEDILNARVEEQKKIFKNKNGNEFKNFYKSDDFKKIGLTPEEITTQARQIEAEIRKHQGIVSGSLEDVGNKIEILQNKLNKGLIPDDAIEKTKNKIKSLQKEQERLNKLYEIVTYQKGSSNDISARKSKLQSNLDDTTVGSEQFNNIKAQLDALTKEEWVVNLRAEGLNDMQIQLRGAMKDFSDFQEGFSAISNVTGSIDSVVSAVDRLNEDIDNDKDGWTQFVDVINIATSTFETIASVMQSVDTIMKLVNATTKATAAQDTAATAQEVSNSMAKTSAKSGEAIAGATSSGASLPFPYNLVAIAAGIAAVLGALALINGGFATGGVVGTNILGTSNPYGHDNMLATVHSGEMLLNSNQQKSLFDALDKGNIGNGYNNGQMQFVLKGADLYGSLKNYSKIKAKSGKTLSL